MLEYKARNGKMRVKPQLGVDITEDDIDEGTEGWCLACGAFGQPAEPDARKYVCVDCGEPAVYGLAELALMGLIAT